MGTCDHGFVKEGNCFTQVSDAAGLARVADAMIRPSGETDEGRLVQVCERWIYSTCLCFALDLAEQERTGFQYSYSVYQAEYSRNFLFESGHIIDMEAWPQPSQLGSSRIGGIDINNPRMRAVLQAVIALSLNP